MKKSMIIALCIMMIALNALTAVAVATTYSNLQSKERRPTVQNQVNGCNVQIDADISSVYFLGNARKECVDKNKHNVLCQNTCFRQIKLLLATSAGRSTSKYSQVGCNDIDPVVYSKATVSQCHFIVSNACVQENPANEFCRKKCNQKAYNGCRQQRARTYAI